MTMTALSEAAHGLLRGPATAPAAGARLLRPGGVVAVRKAPEARQRSASTSGHSGVQKAGALVRAGPVNPRDTEGVENPFVQSIASNFDRALRLMEVALVDCPDDLWETDLWPDEAPTAPTPQGGLHGSGPLVLGVPTLLLTLDYDLTAEFELWEPPEPFDDRPTPFLTVSSPRPNSSATSITAAAGCAVRWMHSPRTRGLGPSPALIDTKACGTGSLSAACHCTFSSTPVSTASSPPPLASKCNLCPAIVATTSLDAGNQSVRHQLRPTTQCAGGG